MRNIFYTTKEVSKESFERSKQFCSDAEAYTDNSGVSNADKWDFVQSIFIDGTLFSEIDFDVLYMSGDHVICEAGSLLADLRTHFIEESILRNNPDDFKAHAHWVANRCWQAKLRELAYLKQYEDDLIADGRLT
jgi:hypothetical protein